MVALKAEKKLAKNGRLVGMLRVDQTLLDGGGLSEAFQQRPDPVDD